MDEEIEIQIDAQERRISDLEGLIARMSNQIPARREPRPAVVWEGQAGTLGSFLRSVGEWRKGKTIGGGAPPHNP